MKVLIIEDDKKLANTYKDILDSVCDVIILENLSRVKDVVRSHKVDVVLLDIMLPDGKGYDIIPLIKSETNAIVIMISALDKVESKRISYEMGADDYMIKPISLFELEFKLKAISKRSNASKSIYNIGDITLDMDKLTLSNSYDSIQIQYSQGVVLKMLYEKYLIKDILYKRELSSFKEDNGIDDFRIHTLISRLRKNIGELDSENIFIENVYGKGYRLVVMK